MSLLLTIAASWGIYALLGMSIVVVYRTSRVLNIAGGELAIFVGYIVAACIAQGMPFALALPVGLAAAALLGLAIFWIMIRRLMGEPPHVGLMVTVGLATFLNGLMVIVFGGGLTAVTTGLPGFASIGTTKLAMPDVVAALGAWLGVGAIALLYRITNIGLQMRALAERVVLSAQRGVNVERIVALSWTLGVVAAGLAGSLHGARAFVSVSASVIGVGALIACLIGGMDSLKGVIVGAFLVAVAETLTVLYVDPRYVLLVPVGILLAVLAIRPWGLFGTVEEFRRV